MAFFYSSLISCFPGMWFRYFLNDIEMVVVVFCFCICCCCCSSVVVIVIIAAAAVVVVVIIIIVCCGYISGLSDMLNLSNAFIYNALT